MKPHSIVQRVMSAFRITEPTVLRLDPVAPVDGADDARLDGNGGG